MLEEQLRKASEHVKTNPINDLLYQDQMSKLYNLLDAIRLNITGIKLIDDCFEDIQYLEHAHINPKLSPSKGVQFYDRKNDYKFIIEIATGSAGFELGLIKGPKINEEDYNRYGLFLDAVAKECNSRISTVRIANKTDNILYINSGLIYFNDATSNIKEIGRRIADIQIASSVCTEYINEKGEEAKDQAIKRISCKRIEPNNIMYYI